MGDFLPRMGDQPDDRKVRIRGFLCVRMEKQTCKIKESNGKSEQNAFTIPAELFFPKRLKYIQLQDLHKIGPHNILSLVERGS